MIGKIKTNGYFTSFDGTEIYYEIIGEGEPIVMAYGLVCTMNHWNQQIKHFSQTNQVILFDYRGHHKSATPSDLDNMSVESIAKDMKILCEHLGIKQATFWGHSFGAQVLCEFYRIAPELVSSLVFVNGFHKNPIKGLLGMDMVPVFLKLKKIHAELPATVEYFWKTLLSSPLAVPAMALSGGFNMHLTERKDIEVYLKGVRSIKVDVFISLFENMMEYDASSFISDIKAPCLVIAGSKDTVTPLHFQKAIHEAIQGSELQIIPYGSHCSQLDMPDFVNLKIEDFLNKQKN